MKITFNCLSSFNLKLSNLHFIFPKNGKMGKWTCRPALDRSDDFMQTFPGVAERRYDLVVLVRRRDGIPTVSSSSTHATTSSVGSKVAGGVVGNDGSDVYDGADAPQGSDASQAAEKSQRLDESRESHMSNGSEASEGGNRSGFIKRSRGFGKPATSGFSSTTSGVFRGRHRPQRSRTIRVVPSDISCYAAEHGIHWLRVRSHLWKHLGGTNISGATVANAVAAQTAIDTDDQLPKSVIARLQAGELEASCRLGCASLRLLGCIAQSGTLSCQGTNADHIMHIALGLIEDGPTLTDAFRINFLFLPCTTPVGAICD